MTDPILEEVRRVREELFKRYGGVDGLFKHLQAMDRARARKAKRQRQKKTGARHSKNARAAKPRASPV